MSKMRIEVEELDTVLSDLHDSGARVVAVLGSVGSEYGYEVAYEGEGDDHLWTGRVRVAEWTPIDDNEETDDLTIGYTDEWKAA